VSENFDGLKAQKDALVEKEQAKLVAQALADQRAELHRQVREVVGEAVGTSSSVRAGRHRALSAIDRVFEQKEAGK